MNNNVEKINKPKFRYRFFWKVLRFFAFFTRKKFAYIPQVCDIKGPVLVLCNHNTDWDPVLLSQAFPNYMSYVASEHIFRWGFLSKVIRFCVDPIARLKGTTAVTTVREILSKIKNGTSVCIFAEGNRSFNGLTNEILSSTGKLAKLSGVTLVTYKFVGGYLTSPRWSKNLRRGKMEGKIVKIYSPKELKEMKPDEINSAIKRDLFVDAYLDQEKEKIAYKGKALAEYLETTLCICPKCGKIGNLKSCGDDFYCSCGYKVRYNEYGYFEGEDVPYKTVLSWDNFQNEKLLDYLPFTDEEISAKEIFSNHTEKVLPTENLYLDREKIKFGDLEFSLDKVSGISLRQAQVVNITCDDRFFELDSKKPVCTRKYMLAINKLKEFRE